MAPCAVTGAGRNRLCMAELLVGREDTLETLQGPLLLQSAGASPRTQTEGGGMPMGGSGQQEGMGIGAPSETVTLPEPPLHHGAQDSHGRGALLGSKLTVLQSAWPDRQCQPPTCPVPPSRVWPALLPLQPPTRSLHPQSQWLSTPESAERSSPIGSQQTQVPGLRRNSAQNRNPSFWFCSLCTLGAFRLAPQ